MSILASVDRPLALVVEDDPLQLRFATAALERAGFRVAAVFDGDDVVAVAASQAPALIVLDLLLPNVGGFDACEALRRDAATAHIPILVMSSRRSPLDRAQAEMAGADDYLVKPVDPVALGVHARALVQGRPAAER